MARGKSWSDIEIEEMKKLLCKSRDERLPLCSVATEKYNVQALQKLNRKFNITHNQKERSVLKMEMAKDLESKGFSNREIAEKMGTTYKFVVSSLPTKQVKRKRWPKSRQIRILNIVKKYKENTGENGFTYVAGRLGIPHSKLYNWNKELKIIETKEEMGPKIIYNISYYEEHILPALKNNNYSLDLTYVQTSVSINTIKRLMNEYNKKNLR